MLYRTQFAYQQLVPAKGSSNNIECVVRNSRVDVHTSPIVLGVDVDVVLHIRKMYPPLCLVLTLSVNLVTKFCKFVKLQLK